MPHISWTYAPVNTPIMLETCYATPELRRLVTQSTLVVDFSQHKTENYTKNPNQHNIEGLKRFLTTTCNFLEQDSWLLGFIRVWHSSNMVQTVSFFLVGNGVLILRESKN